jgi:methylmalonyl-CoA epimerase
MSETTAPGAGPGLGLDGARLDHLGIAVESLEQGAALYEALGLEVGGIEVVASQGVRVGVVEVGESRIELLEPHGEGSPIATFLASRGPGMHHVCLSVPDLRAAMQRLRSAGLRLLQDEPVPGAHGALVCFVHPRSAGGVLLELSQPAATSVPGER